MKRGLYPGTAEAIEKFGEGFLVKHTVTLRTDAVGTQTLFNVTGEVEVIVIGYIDTTVTSDGALTLEVGVSGATDGLIAQTAVGDLTEGKIWVDASPSVLKAKPSWKNIANGGMSDEKQKERDMLFWLNNLREGKVNIEIEGEAPILLKKNEGKRN